jgi:dTDP-4-amino-4,6-dideoxygalactose transaminase
MSILPYGRQSINEDDIESVSKVLRSDWLTTGPAVLEFEQKICEATKSSNAISVTSGTAALHVAYAAAGIGAGDEIITPPMTFVATQATAIQLGAKIVFADVQSDTLNIDPTEVKSKITKNTKAIVAVDYAGHPADMDELRKISDEHDLILIEDAAHSVGSTYRNQEVGSLADLTCLSFFPTKNMTTGEGGAVVTNDDRLAIRSRRFRGQGLVRDENEFKISGQGAWHQEVHEFGLNYRLPDILAALGSSQISRLAEFKEARKRIFGIYNDAFDGLSGIEVPSKREYVDPMWHLYPIRIKDGRRRAVFDLLRSEGIGVQVNYIPAYWHPAFNPEQYPLGLCPISEKFYEEEISLPIYAGLKDSDVIRVIEAVKRAI